MKYTWRTELPALALVALSIGIAAWGWGHVPDPLPVHWDLSGQPNRWGGRGEALLLPAGIAMVLFLAFRVIPFLDPGRANYEKFAGPFFTLRLVIIALMVAVQGLAIASARGQQTSGEWVLAAVGIVLIVIGNLLGKLRPNWFMGIRTPWTLSSKLAWSKTHRAGGWVFVAGGVLFLAAGAVARPWATMTAAIVIGAGVLGLVVYSYMVWRDDPDRVPPAGTLPANGT